MRLNGFAIMTVIFLALAFFTWKNEKKKAERLANLAPVRTSTVVRSSSDTNLSEHANIDQTLRIVADKLGQKIDVNRDGLTNCIDAAVTFYKYYPDKSKVCIEINVNPKTGMNHLFNCVYTNGVWKAIEPQSYYSNHINYLMWEAWGNEYDNTYNRDETEIWKAYAK